MSPARTLVTKKKSCDSRIHAHNAVRSGRPTHEVIASHQIYDVQGLCCLDVPEPNCPVGAARDQRTARNLHAPHSFPVTDVRSKALMRLSVPGLLLIGTSPPRWWSTCVRGFTQQSTSGREEGRLARGSTRSNSHLSHRFFFLAKRGFAL